MTSRSTRNDRGQTTMSDVAMEDQVSLLSTRSVQPSPDTLTKLIKRIRALTLKLLPLEVELDAITDPTSRVVTPAVISAYVEAAGDFGEALPYCLLRARQSFIWDANHDTADYGENMSRAMACETLARRILHTVPPDRLDDIMSCRFQHAEWDGDESALSSALELAIDQQATVFLSCSEAQHVVNSLWRGDWVQVNGENNRIEYEEYRFKRDGSFWSHIDPSRLSVPRYQNVFRITLWLGFLFIYSRVIQQPIEQNRQPRHPLDEWEVLLYVQALAYTMEESHKLYKILRYFTWRAFTFWRVVSIITYSLLVTAFGFRVWGLYAPDDDQSSALKLRSFQLLSCVSPLIWMRLITVVEGFKYVGTMQICVSRMLQESTIFFVLLSILGIGFAQGMYALDAADGVTDHGSTVINTLLQALLQAPDFENPAVSNFGLVLYYMWNVATTVILLNILISLFSSAYEDITDDAEAHFMAFFAEKTIGMIRAPDNYVYPAPFNLIEMFLVVPFELVLDRKSYAKLNRRVMFVIFFIPLILVALFEAHLDTRRNIFMRHMFSATQDGEDEDPNNRDPQVSDESGLVISKKSFDEIVKAFPNSFLSSEATIMQELQSLRNRMEELFQQLEDKKAKKATT
ncbi:Calcium channel YVC1 OS=Saccharomyces cerevisiae (strain ATCC 204508 / S288c) GN=YVC1 PE=1 SV=2 [Rhizoctonia solani AG-1 IB]|uniref:Calcium channel YVC1 n=1 Tax=Thanatephorus cucumeris (strain AG1-IB / isolate 7/3/14) TaxID=1108050 RepID=A0A0B7G3K1_THACB|nr:Calcium channel YVC1 OS=Saccharomyces cerevisiae (strain ATCC 204508 / S288c) GN=YVC1 PE=1 SV=2 [Rhizoctonia solani AG-1 IB]